MANGSAARNQNVIARKKEDKENSRHFFQACLCRLREFLLMMRTEGFPATYANSPKPGLHDDRVTVPHSLTRSVSPLPLPHSIPFMRERSDN